MIYKTKGTCSKEIQFEITDNKIHDVKFVGGCQGNLKALSKLVDGLEVSEVITKLKGITCGNKPTSCADQLCKALEEVVAHD